MSTKLNGSHCSGASQSGPRSAKRRSERDRPARLVGLEQLGAAGVLHAPVAAQQRAREVLPERPDDGCRRASSTSWRPRNSNTVRDLIMKRCGPSSGARRKRMSSLIFIFFCLTNSSGCPSSVEPGGGTLIRYSLAIGLKTCWTRKRSDRSIAARTVSVSLRVASMRSMLAQRRSAGPGASRWVRACYRGSAPVADRARGIAAPRRPGAGIQPSGRESGVLEHEQGVARGDAGAAVRHDGRASRPPPRRRGGRAAPRPGGAARRRPTLPRAGRLRAPGMWPARGSTGSSWPV